MKTKKLQIVTGIPPVMGREGTFFPVFCAVGTQPANGGAKRIEIRLFAGWDEAVKAGQEMIFQHYADVNVGRAEHLKVE